MTIGLECCAPGRLPARQRGGSESAAGDGHARDPASDAIGGRACRRPTRGHPGASQQRTVSVRWEAGASDRAGWLG